MEHIEDLIRNAVIKADVTKLQELLHERQNKSSIVGEFQAEENLFHVLAESAPKRDFVEYSNEYCNKPLSTSAADYFEAEAAGSLPFICEDFIYNSVDADGDLDPPWKWLEHINQSELDKRRKAIVYILSEDGEDINAVDQYGRTTLSIACYKGDASLCDPLLQCGADPNAIINGQPIIVQAENLALMEQFRQRHEEKKCDNCSPSEEKCSDEFCGPSRVVFEICKFYWPGLWLAVGSQSVKHVRRLLNCWCRVDIQKNGRKLRELASFMGNETIITLLDNIQPTMNIIHKVLAQNTEAVRDLLESASVKKININLKKMSERGAPLIYFVIQSKDILLLKELLKYGASPYAVMQDKDMVEMPVVFAALTPDVNPELVQTLLLANTGKNCMLDFAWFKGKSVLRVAIENNVSDEVVKAIVNIGGPSQVAERDSTGKTILDILLTLKKEALVSEIEKIIYLWLSKPTLYPGWREILALRGFDRFKQVSKSEAAIGCSDHDLIESFLNEVNKVQELLRRIFEAVQSNSDVFVQLLNFESEAFHAIDILWQGRLQHDGMPLLHWVVLHNRIEMLDLILQRTNQYHDSFDSNHTTKSLSIDDIRDFWRRTALHYAYGMVQGQPIRKLLTNNGATEHTLDMYSREPLDFREACGSQQLNDLLQNLRDKKYETDQETPWNPTTLRLHQERKRKQRFIDRANNPQHDCSHSHHSNHNNFQSYPYPHHNFQCYPDPHHNFQCYPDPIQSFQINNSQGLRLMTQQRFYSAVSFNQGFATPYQMYKDGTVYTDTGNSYYVGNRNSICSGNEEIQHTRRACTLM